jgi:hypothetical protein
MIRWFKEMLLLSILLVPPMAFPSAGVCPARLPSRTPRGSAAGVLRPAGVGLLDSHSLAAFVGWGLAACGKAARMAARPRRHVPCWATCVRLARVRHRRLVFRGDRVLRSVPWVAPNVARLVPAGELLSSVCLLALEEEACVG